MRPFRTDTVLSSIPTGAFLQLFQAPGSSKNNEPAAVSASVVASATELANLKTEVQLVGRDAIIATVDGLTTGLIPAEAHFAQITSDSVNKQVSLPSAVAGKQIYLQVDAVGVEVISAVPADTLNNVVIGATNEAALVVGTLYSAIYDGANWAMTGVTITGAVEAPVVPDAL